MVPAQPLREAPAPRGRKGVRLRRRRGVGANSALCSKGAPRPPPPENMGNVGSSKALAGVCVRCSSNKGFAPSKALYRHLAQTHFPFDEIPGISEAPGLSVGFAGAAPIAAAAVSTPVIDEVRGTPVAMQPGGRSPVCGTIDRRKRAISDEAQQG